MIPLPSGEGWGEGNSIADALVEQWDMLIRNNQP
jgi:hypothetical protein